MSHTSGKSLSSSQQDTMNVVTSSHDDTPRPSAPKEPPRSFPSRIYDLLRPFNLQIFAHLGDWRKPTERRKICIHQSYPLAALRCLVHLVPLGGAVTLLVLNWTRYFVGPGFSATTALQFAAKFHELLMQASIVEVILCIIRNAVVDGYVPLGVLSASLQAYQISYLWSLDFVSAIHSEVFHGWRKIAFVFTIPPLIVLTTLVGPSSAVLMIPRPGMNRIVGLDVQCLAGSLEYVFPSKLNVSQGLDFNTDYFPAQYLATVYKELRETDRALEQSLIDSSGQGPPRLVQWVTGTESGASMEPSFKTSIATIPTRLCANRMRVSPLLRDFYSIGPTKLLPNTTEEVEILRPVVVTRCTKRTSWLKTLDAPLTYIRDDGTSRGEVSAFRELIQDYAERGGNNTTIDHLPPFWAPHPGPGSSSLIGIFPLFRSDNTSHPLPTVSNMLASQGYIEIGPNYLYLFTCTISSFWEPSRHELVRNYGSELLRSSPLAESGYSKPKYRNPVAMNISSIPGFNHTNITQQMRSQDISNNDYISATLAIAFATALSEIPRPSTVIDCARNREGKLIGTNFTTFEYKNTQYGFGYGNPSTSVRLALAVITTYCIVISGYMVYLLFTGLTSTAWNSAIELVVLALQSKRPDHLGHTSVGIDSMETYREEVGIRVNDQEQLELVFAHDKDADTRGLRKVVPNKRY